MKIGHQYLLLFGIEIKELEINNTNFQDIANLLQRVINEK